MLAQPHRLVVVHPTQPQCNMMLFTEGMEPHCCLRNVGKPKPSQLCCTREALFLLEAPEGQAAVLRTSSELSSQPSVSQTYPGNSSATRHQENRYQMLASGLHTEHAYTPHLACHCNPSPQPPHLELFLATSLQETGKTSNRSNTALKCWLLQSYRAGLVTSRKF